MLNWNMYIVLAMLLSTPIYAATSFSTDYQLRSFFGSGGISEQTLTELNSNVSFGFTQYIIGNNTATLREGDFGLYYIATLASVSPIILPPAKIIFVIYVMERGLEYIKLNWAG